MPDLRQIEMKWRPKMFANDTYRDYYTCPGAGLVFDVKVQVIVGPLALKDHWVDGELLFS